MAVASCGQLNYGSLPARMVAEWAAFHRRVAGLQRTYRPSQLEYDGVFEGVPRPRQREAVSPGRLVQLARGMVHSWMKI